MDKMFYSYMIFLGALNVLASIEPPTSSLFLFFLGQIVLCIWILINQVAH